MTPPLSLLGLFHPLGRARRAFVLGGDGVSTSRPDAAGTADLVVIAPTAVEADDSVWLEAAAAGAASALARDGLVYVLAPAAARRRLARALSRDGLADVAFTLHLGDLSRPRVVLPLDAGAADYALSQLATSPRLLRRALVAALSVPGLRRVLGLTLPKTALVARHPGQASLFVWLDAPPPAVVCRGWAGVSATVHAGGSPPTVVAKVALVPAAEAGISAEARNLSRLRPRAEAAGARLPQPLPRRGRPDMLVTHGLPGRCAAALLAERPDRLDHVLRAVTAWVEAWNARTATARRLERELIEADVLEPARRLAPELPGGVEYLHRLQRLGAALAGRTVPLVAAHGDLTMWNVLVDVDSRLSVVDWEHAREQALPLGDALYAIADAHTALASASGSREAAFLAARAASAAAEARFAARLGLESDVVILCRNACWLHHASNEQRRGDRAEERPFLAILAHVAAGLRS